MSGSVTAKLLTNQTMSCAILQNHIPLLRKLILQNQGNVPIIHLYISLSFIPGFADNWGSELEILPAGGSVEIDVSGIRVNEKYIAELEQQTQAEILLEVLGEEGLLVQERIPLTLLTAHQWIDPESMPELAAAYLTPRHPQVVQLAERAACRLRDQGEMSGFTGYLSQNPDVVRTQMEAIYETIRQESLTVTEEVPSPYPAVRFAGEMLEERAGSPLDFTLLYCSCLEAVGLRPLLVFSENQVTAGCWLENYQLPESIEEEVSFFEMGENHPGSALAVDASGCGQNRPASFQDAVRTASARLLDGEFSFVLGVSAARANQIVPVCLDWEETVPCAEENASGSVRFSAEERGTELTRQQFWERRLLDLSLRNMLINFRVTQRTLQLIAADYTRLEDALSVGMEFQVLGQSEKWEGGHCENKIYYMDDENAAVRTLVESEIDHGYLRSFLSEEETESVMTALYRQARISLEENGSNTLFIAIGFLRWYETDVSEKPRYAPLMLVPIEIVRKSSRRGFVVRMRDEEPQMNITLLEMLRQDFGIQISGLDPLPRDQNGIDVAQVFRIVEQMAAQNPRWQVEQLAFMGLFSFSQFIMWSDIRNRAEDLKRSKIVRSLMSGQMEWTPDSDFPQPELLDEEYRPEQLAVPITADASQLSAICAAGSGKSFVLHGPPGTGKSQTITNIIANALYQGKTVLFLAEKMAALSVVQKRLQKIGLGTFSLELHSNKAKKRDVLSQLQQALEIGRIRPSDEYKAQAEHLYQLRQELNDYVKALHRKHPCGLSAWDAITRYEMLLDAPADVCFMPEDLQNLTENKLRIWEDIAEDLQAAAAVCGGPSDHPLREWKLRGYSSSVRSELSSNIAELGRLLVSLKKQLREFCGGLGIPTDGNAEYFRNLVELAKILQQDRGFPACLLTGGDLEPLRTSFEELCDGGRRRDAAREALLLTFKPEILLFNEPTARKQWEDAQKSWFLPRMMGEKKVMKALRDVSKDPKSLMKEQVVSYLNLLAEYDSGTRVIAGKEPVFAVRFGPLWKEREADWRELEKNFDVACDVQKVVAKMSEDPNKRKDILMSAAMIYLSTLFIEEDRTGRNLTLLLNTLNEVDQTVRKLWALGEVRADMESGELLGQLEEYQQRWGSNLSLLRDWCNWTAVEQRALDEGLGALVGVCRSGSVEPEELINAYHRGLYSSCADYMIEESPALSSFHGAMFEKKVQKFRRTCKDFEQLTRSELVARLSAKIPSHSGEFAASSEIGILQKAIRSGGRNLPIRRLFDSIPNLLRLLCPCMLMSPISVAQYIDPQSPPFDLVIFDEASQLPTCEAVGAIARGENVIVVGDPKQLPPTSFFMGSHGEEDFFEQQDLESILDDCLAISMPEEHLRWHYRSRHESLIAFSNRQYYENKLYTFPAPNNLESKVKLIPVEGAYDRGKTKQNRAEAEAVVAEILRRLSDETLCRESIGVVTFSAVQQNLIEDLLMEAFCAHPELEERNSAAEEPIFIKNLENVQGDERDVILFSIGYGPDKDGRVTMNFGPLNREGGWRRLNVAVSRARKEMRVYSTLRADQLDISKIHAEGVAGLKAFLEFAEKGYSALAAPAQEVSAGTPFAELLAKHIRRMGYQVDTNVGCSAFRIDLAVVDPRYPGEYLLGILCDGEYYMAGKTARDRNMNQESVLRSLGWHLHHVWGLEWRENPARELFRIRAAIEEALQQERLVPMPTPPEEKRQFVFDEKNLEREPEPEEKLVSYTVCTLPQKTATVDEFCHSKHDEEIFSQLKKVVEAEGPVSSRVLCRRVMNAWGVGRMSVRIERRFAPLLERLNATTTHCGDVTFYWSRRRGPRKYTGFRVSENADSRREVEDIPNEEIANAIRYVLERQIGLSREDLIREVYRLFGFQRAGSSIAESAEGAIQLALRRGYAAMDEGRLILPQE